MKSTSKKVWRCYQFPPLHTASDEEQREDLKVDEVSYQQQIMAGFEQGVRDGFEQGKAEGMAAGLEEGRKAGLLQGREEGKKQALIQFTQAVVPVDGLITQLRQELAAHEQRRRQELLQLVEKVTRQVIRCELALQPTQLLSLIEEGLSSLPAFPTRLRVLLNPEEFTRISELEPGKIEEWGLTAEPTLEVGECRIVTESAEMDVGCDHRLGQCMEALQQHLAAEPNNNESEPAAGD